MANDPQVVPIHLTILPWQQRMLAFLQAGQGLLTASETLRSVLTHYARLIEYTPESEQPQETPA